MINLLDNGKTIKNLDMANILSVTIHNRGLRSKPYGIRIKSSVTLLYNTPMEMSTKGHWIMISKNMVKDYIDLKRVVILKVRSIMITLLMDSWFIKMVKNILVVWGIWNGMGLGSIIIQMGQSKRVIGLMMSGWKRILGIITDFF